MATASPAHTVVVLNSLGWYVHFSSLLPRTTPLSTSILNPLLLCRSASRIFTHYFILLQVITYAQLERLEDLSVSDPERVKVIKKARVTKLVKDSSGAVVGVEYECGGKTETAYGPVILATGGYAADFTGDSLLKKYRPEYYELPTTNGEHSTGDGHKLALSIGASAIDLEKVQVHPTGLVDPKEPDAKVKFLAAEALRGVGGLLLDNTGKRFVDELQHRDYVTGKMWENGKYPIRLVLNGKASKDIEWHCKHYVGRGLMKRFDSGEALAKEFGLAPEVLRKTFEDYNVSVRTQKDPFGKKVRASSVLIDFQFKLTFRLVLPRRMEV